MGLVGLLASMGCRSGSSSAEPEPVAARPALVVEPDVDESEPPAPLVRPEDDGKALPAYGLASLEDACARLLANVSLYDEDASCHPEDARLAESGDWGLLVAEGAMQFYALVVRTEADGWSMDGVAFEAWTGGAEMNLRLLDATFETWAHRQGPLLVVEFDAEFTNFERGVPRESGTEVAFSEVIICAREPTWARCSRTITTTSERRYPLPPQRYEAKLSLDGDTLVVDGPQLDGFDPRYSAYAAPHSYFAPGRYSLDELLSPGS
ncbi:hypothetical protein DB30_05205 [Enhygromyxa salina]|uniref:Uncharacterized protein n=2 Tax=Enhygromyxa salina TaxID=215803 RepID=A0A0C2D6Y5_9BACT|nr:hypothetical protein DB30_05205 [Enhygromyxa salina]